MRGYESPIAPLRLSVRSADARIELIADTVLRRCLSALGLSDIPLPVPVEDWIERPLGYRLNIVSPDDAEEGVMGLARPALGEIEVVDTLDSNESRYRFTCAHELGHVLMHTTSGEAYRDGALPQDHPLNDIEHEADRFAAAFLMPVSTLSAAFESIRIEQGLAVEAMSLLRGDDALTVWLWRRCFLPALCDRYAVSRAAMTYRCREVRLPGKRRLVRPSLVPMLTAPEKLLQPLNLDQIRLANGVPALNGSR